MTLRRKARLPPEHHKHKCNGYTVFVLFEGLIGKVKQIPQRDTSSAKYLTAGEKVRREHRRKA